MNKAPTKHQLRIVGGTLKRSLLPVPDLPGLRPTPDRVRETLFNWLGHQWDLHFADKIVLDLFAGSGALGFEAASRGCAAVHLIEKQASAVRHLRAFVSKHQLSNVQIHQQDAFAWLPKAPAADLLLLDPPFHQGLMDRLRPSLAAVCRPQALIYAESELTLNWHLEADGGMELLRSARAGKVRFHLFRTLGEPENPA